jgi:hypothetical protein
MGAPNSPGGSTALPGSAAAWNSDPTAQGAGSAPFRHQGVMPGGCVTCHNGSRAPAKPARHIPAMQSCDACHRTTAWKPAAFSHSGIAPGTCITCHNGNTATGKSGAHFVTPRTCDTCHRTTAWIPTANYSHLTPYYRTHNSSVTCRNCHTTNNEVMAWKFAAYKPDCGGCHANRFNLRAHKKSDNPASYYTMAELKDCSGSCHLYVNSTYTTIKSMRTGQHRSSSGGFN